MKNIILFLLLIFNQFIYSQKQNLFNEQNTLKFAMYLQNTGNYSFAAEEFERLYFLVPQKKYALHLLKNNRLANQQDIAINRFMQFPDSLKNEYTILKEYYRTQISIQNYSSVYKDITDRQTLNNPENTEWTLAMLMMDEKYPEARHFFENQSSLQKYDNLFVGLEQLSLKNAYLAATFSAIMPGSGKLYAGRWKDAIFSFVLVGSTAFQAYRGFSKNGINSTYGWIFSGLSLSFYAGNVFGAFDAAKMHNKKIYDNYHQKVSAAFYPLIWTD